MMAVAGQPKPQSGDPMGQNVNDTIDSEAFKDILVKEVLAARHCYFLSRYPDIPLVEAEKRLLAECMARPDRFKIGHALRVYKYYKKAAKPALEIEHAVRQSEDLLRLDPEGSYPAAARAREITAARTAGAAIKLQRYDLNSLHWALHAIPAYHEEIAAKKEATMKAASESWRAEHGEPRARAGQGNHNFDVEAILRSFRPGGYTPVPLIKRDRPSQRRTARVRENGVVMSTAACLAQEAKR